MKTVKWKIKGTKYSIAEIGSYLSLVQKISIGNIFSFPIHESELKPLIKNLRKFVKGNR